LEKLDFMVTPINECGLLVKVPHHRHDCTESADITEELVRLQNVNCVQDSALSIFPSIKQDNIFDTNNQIKKLLLHKQYKEVVNHLFIEEDVVSRFGHSNNDLKLLYPINNCNVVQCHAIPNLLKNLSHNISQHNIKSLSLMESTTEHRDCQNYDNVFVGIRYGNMYIMPSSGGQAFDIFDVKADVVDILSNIYHYPRTLIDISITPMDDRSYLHPFKSFEIVIDGHVVAEFGAIHPKVLKEVFDISGEVFFLRIFVDRLTQQSFEESRISFLHQEREMSFLLDKSISVGRLISAIASVDSRINNVFVNDVFVNDKDFGEESRSVNVSFSFSDNINLTKEEILTIMHSIQNVAHVQTGAKLRGQLPDSL
jgi:phenylalanyl-tRNA synthetase beta chain